MIFGTPPIVTNGLVLHLDAGSRQSYVSGSTTWTNLSRNGYDGTLKVSGSGAVSASFSSLNQGSIQFSGTGSYADYGNILNIGLNSWTLSCWAKINTSAGIIGIVGKTSARDYVGRYSFFIESSLLYGFLQPAAATNVFVSASAPPLVDGRFHHLVMTINRTSVITFYIDGALVNTSTNISAYSATNLTGSTDYLYVGSYADATGQQSLYPLNGNVAQVQIYNRSLSAQEVNQNYNALKARFGLT